MSERSEETGTEATIAGVEATAVDAEAPTTGWNDEPAVPHRIGRFLVLEELGEGAMGMVYAASSPRSV